MMTQEISTTSGKDVTEHDEVRGSGTAMFAPAVDIVEKDAVTVIFADMPGVAPEDVEVTLERQVLTLTGRVRGPAPEGYRRLSSEYREGDYSRVFTLSDSVDQNKIKADLKNGVLRLELPRAAEAKPKKIAVKAA
jgi:HSP20 family molecular chaperone IbpA